MQPNDELQLSIPFDSNISCHAVLVSWRNRWATGLRLLAPLMFLAMALMVQEVMIMNERRTGRIRDIPTTFPEPISSIPACSSELFIHDKPCLDFIFTPKDDSRIQVCAGLPLVTCQVQPVDMAVMCSLCSVIPDHSHLTNCVPCLCAGHCGGGAAAQQSTNTS